MSPRELSAPQTVALNGPDARLFERHIAAAEAKQRALVQVRLPKWLVRRIDHLAVDAECSRAAMVERLLREALS